MFQSDQSIKSDCDCVILVIHLRVFTELCLTNTTTLNHENNEFLFTRPDKKKVHYQESTDLSFYCISLTSANVLINEACKNVVLIVTIYMKRVEADW